MTIGTIGYFLASVAADGMMVEVAQREPLMTRGHTQMSISVARTAGSLFMSLFVSGTLNGLEYGGSFSWSLSLNQIMFAFAAFALIPLVGSIWCLHEDFAVQRALVFSCSDIVSCSAAPPNTTSLNPPLNFSDRCQLVWRLIRSRIMWQLLVFELISSFCLTINSSAKPAIEEIWIGVGAWPNALGTAVWSVAFIGGLFMTRCFFMHSGWRRLYCAAILWMVGVDVVMVTCTISDVMRNCNFWMYMQVLAAPAVGMRFLVQILPIIELAPRGIEGTAYGLVITFRYIAIPLGTTTFKVIGSYFSISDEDVHRDSDSTRLQIAYTYLIAWAFQLMSLAFIGLFPCQKLAIQHLRYHGGYSTLAGWLVVIVMFCALIYATTVSILLLSKSTSCLRMAGGSGC
ncbi:unnamed protein product [Peronospora belbahrii]|nr:unnamed protein product [Peronospora belbahrii]